MDQWPTTPCLPLPSFTMYFLYWHIGIVLQILKFLYEDRKCTSHWRTCCAMDYSRLNRCVDWALWLRSNTFVFLFTSAFLERRHVHGLVLSLSCPPTSTSTTGLVRLPGCSRHCFLHLNTAVPSEHFCNIPLFTPRAGHFYKCHFYYVQLLGFKNVDYGTCSISFCC